MGRRQNQEANYLGHESPKVAILSTQNDHFEKCSFETIPLYRQNALSAFCRAKKSPRQTRGKGRVRVNPSPGFVGDRGCGKDLHARRPKGLGGFIGFGF